MDVWQRCFDIGRRKVSVLGMVFSRAQRAVRIIKQAVSQKGATETVQSIMTLVAAYVGLAPKAYVAG